MEYFDVNDPTIKSRLIIENERVFAFLSKMPIVPGHTLICPKRHVSKIDDLTADELHVILLLQKELKRAMIKAFGAEGFNYAWNEGKIAGQSVNHLHLHMLPRKKSDSGIFEYEPRKFLYRPGERPVSPEQKLSEVAKLIKDNL
jgi:diadenosine tetraphosphate (Ap4A) HIT family hydrolase